MKNEIEIGKIVASRGLDGTIKINSAFLKQDFKNLKTCFVENVEYKIEKYSGKKLCLFFKLENVNNIEEAEKLKNKKIFVNREDIVLKDDEYLVDDLINMQVFTDEDVLLGNLISIENFGSKDVYTIKNNKTEHTFCLIEGLIKEVDYKNNKIILNSKKLNEVLVWR